MLQHFKLFSIWSIILMQDWHMPSLYTTHSQSYGFPVVMCGHESWIIKKAEHQRMDAFKLWCWRRFLRVPWTARRSNQATLKQTIPGYSLEGLMLRLKLQYFGHLMQRTDSWKRPWIWERLKAGGEGDDREWDGWMATQWTRIGASSRRQWRTRKPGVLQSMGFQRIGHDRATEQHRQAATAALTWLPGEMSSDQAE